MPTDINTDNAVTFHQRGIQDALEEMGGRFARRKDTSVIVTGSTPVPTPPRISGNGPWAQFPNPTEPPTGEAIDELPSMETNSGIDRQEALAIDAERSAGSGSLPSPGPADADADADAQPIINRRGM
jgi:hypothetical protein